MASNGDLNPIWVNNMARMAAAGKDADGDLDMEDTDLEGTVTGECRSLSTGPRNPTWADLSRRMQAEIFQNLLERYSYPTVCRMLGLTADERDDIENTLEYRRKQIEQEDIHLDAMRAKQLRELSRMDNSFRTQKQSYQLVFRKASRQTFRALRDFIEPDRDFFACEGSELTIAKAFLCRRGLEPKFMGTWGNGIALIRASDGEAPPLGMFGLDGAPGPNPVSPTSNEAYAPTPIIVPELQSETSDALKNTFTDWLGNSPASSSLEIVQPNGNRSKPGRYLIHIKETIDQEKGHCTNSERQAPGLGHHNRRSVLPEIPPALMSSQLDRYPEDLALKYRQQQRRQQQNNRSLRSSSAPISLPKEKNTFSLQLPPQRSNGELSCRRAETRDIPYFPPPTNRQSAGIRQEQNTQRQRLIELQEQQGSTADTVSEPLKWSLEEPLRTDESSSSSPETGLSRFSDLSTPQTAATNTPLTSTRPGNHGQLLDEDEAEDKSTHWDEMVLFPSD
ncbi:hypothetical protein BDW75DRAFT_205330 [Aspergillus navahoensis]